MSPDNRTDNLEELLALEAQPILLVRLRFLLLLLMVGVGASAATDYSQLVGADAALRVGTKGTLAVIAALAVFGVAAARRLPWAQALPVFVLMTAIVPVAATTSSLVSGTADMMANVLGVIAIGTAVLLPWGVRAQIALLAVILGCFVALMAFGNSGLGVGSAGVRALAGIGAAVYVAQVLDSQRRDRGAAELRASGQARILRMLSTDKPTQDVVLCSHALRRVTASGNELLASFVDDNETNRIILREQLHGWGVDVLLAESGAGALEILETDRSFDVAILDMLMPEMDGVELADEIRKRASRRDLPLLLLTSVGPNVSRTEGEEGGPRSLAHFAAVLTKPAKPALLGQALSGILTQTIQPAIRQQSQSEFDRTLAEARPLKILLAEANQINQKVAVKMLDRMDYRADVAANGLEAARAICARWAPGKRPRIIAMTANAMQKDRDECQEAGMDDYVSKPFPVKVVAAALERCQPVESAPVPEPTHYREV